MSKTASSSISPYIPDLHDAHDNSPWTGAGAFGRLGKGSYYMQDTPSKTQYAITARKTPLGKRITYIYADDIWANNFAFEFPDLDVSKLEKDEINSEIRQHLNEIHFYEEGRRVCGFDFEQGEAILQIYREGDGIIYLEKPQKATERDNPLYLSFMTPHNFSKPILRVEAVNYLDYTMPAVGAFGKPPYYQVQFHYNTSDNSSTYSMYRIHPSRVIRWRSDNIDYEVYAQASKMTACFDHLQLIQTMLHNMGNAVKRFAYGQPWISTKGLKTKEARQKAKDAIGDPLDGNYFMTPTENIVDIKMLGVQQSQMDVSKLILDNAQLVAASVGIPKQILLAEQVGMNKPGQVVNPDYFAAIDKEHNKQNQFIRQFVNIDPFFQALFQKHKILHYEINWGLRQVMTQMEQMDFDMRRANNAMTQMGFKCFKEVRNYMGDPSWEEFFKTIEGGDAICMKFYNLTPRELDMIVPNFLTLRQVGASEIVETPEEQELAAEREQELVQNNNPENVNRSQNESTPGSQKREAATKEGLRREMKNIREGAAEGGKDDADKDVLIAELRHQLAEFRVQKSMRDIAEEMGVTYKTLYKMQEYFAQQK